MKKCASLVYSIDWSFLIPIWLDSYLALDLYLVNVFFAFDSQCHLLVVVHVFNNAQPRHLDIPNIPNLLNLQISKSLEPHSCHPMTVRVLHTIIWLNNVLSNNATNRQLYY